MNMSFEYRFSVRRSAKIPSKFQVAFTAHEIKLSIQDFFSKCKQNHSLPSLIKCLRENFVFV